MKDTNYLPKGYRTITPALAFRDTEKAIDWYVHVFGATEKSRIARPDNKIMHAELTIGDSIFFLGEENPQYKNLSPSSTNGNSVCLYLYVKDVDAVFKKAVNEGATVIMEPMDMFYGDRCAGLNDPFGYTWTLSTHIKDVSETEMKKMAAEMAQG